jgi:hypothetical protein
VPLNDLPEVGAQFLLARGGNVNHQYINIENGMVRSDWSNDGQSILVPTDSTTIPNMVHSLFSDPNLAQENTSVAILNGSASSGAASDAQSTLQGLGFRTVSTGNANSAGYTRNQVIVNTAVSGSADYTARRLQRLFNADLVKEPIPGQSAQIEVVLGSEFPG